MTKFIALFSSPKVLNIRPYNTNALKINVSTVTIHRNHRKVEFGRRFKLDDNPLHHILYILYSMKQLYYTWANFYIMIAINLL